MANPELCNPSDEGVSDVVALTVSDLTAALYCFGDITAGVIAVKASGTPAGVLQDANLGTATASLPATLRVSGQTRLKLGGTVTAGQFLKPTTGGKAVAATSDHDVYGAFALDDGVDGDTILALVCHGTISA